MKNPPNNNHPPQPDLLPASQSTKPISCASATAAQLTAAYPFLAGHIDDTFLRNRAREINARTGDTWIPKPRANQYPIAPTLLGLLEWFFQKSITRSDLPAKYANMQAMENALGTDKKAIRWLLKNGAGAAQDPANRIAPIPVIRAAFDLIAHVASGNVTGIDGLEEWNKDTELAKKLREEREKLEDEKKIRRGNILLSQDQTYAIENLVADQILWEKRDQPLRAALVAAPKQINRQLRTLLANADDLRGKTDRLCAHVTATINAVLAKLRTKTPKPILEAESDEG